MSLPGRMDLNHATLTRRTAPAAMPNDEIMRFTGAGSRLAQDSPTTMTTNTQGIAMDEKLKKDARRLYKFLHAYGWQKQRDIGEALDLSGPTVRKIANEFAPYFISNTRDGYNVFRNVSNEEVEHSIADLRSRAIKITQRAELLESALGLRRAEQADMFIGQTHLSPRDKTLQELIDTTRDEGRPTGKY